jgi:hypothetical protein
MLADVRQTTIRPVIETSVAKGALVHTDEYGVYARLEEWGYGHKTVCHARGEYGRIGGSRRRSCPPVSASSSSSTTPGAAGKRSSAPSSPAWSRRPILTTPKPDKSQSGTSSGSGRLGIVLPDGSSTGSWAVVTRPPSNDFSSA